MDKDVQNHKNSVLIAEFKVGDLPEISAIELECGLAAGL